MLKSQSLLGPSMSILSTQRPVIVLKSQLLVLLTGRTVVQ